MIGTSRGAFWFSYSCLGTGAATSTFKNVALINRQNNKDNNYYGLIFVDTYDFNIIIDSSQFVNTNFAGIIHCNVSSNCTILIKNSTFFLKNELCADNEDVINGMYLANGANGDVTIENSLFVGILWIYNGSTSTVSIDSVTVMIDSNSNSECSKRLDVFVSKEMYVRLDILDS